MIFMCKPMQMYANSKHGLSIKKKNNHVNIKKKCMVEKTNSETDVVSVRVKGRQI